MENEFETLGSVQLIKENDSYSFSFPESGFSNKANIILFFAIFWNAVTYAVVFLNENTPVWLMSILIISGLILILIAIFNIKGSVDLTLDKEDLTVKYSMSGFHFDRNRSTSNLQSVTETLLYTTKDKHVWAIELVFKSERKIRIGAMLSEHERLWVIGKLKKIIASHSHSID